MLFQEMSPRVTSATYRLEINFGSSFENEVWKELESRTGTEGNMIPASSLPSHRIFGQSSDEDRVRGRIMSLIGLLLSSCSGDNAAI